MKKPDFVYVSYIAATPERVWAAMTDPKFAQQFFGTPIDCVWEAGATFRLVTKDGRLLSEGQILEVEPLRRIRLTWLRGLDIDGKTFREMPRAWAEVTIEPMGDVVKLTATEMHEDPVDEGYLEGGREGWPVSVARLKTLVETGHPLPPFRVPAH